MKTFSLKSGDICPKWYLIDAKDLVVGRLASIIARILRGKTDPTLTPHLDHGGRVVVVNARHVHFTGGKDKPLYRHTGYPGGIKHSLPSDVLAGAHPERVLSKAVERMMGKNGPLRRDRMKNLFIYPESEHVHQAQQPVTLHVRDWNIKNCKKENAS
jgi:large subunit ribosomal protein L13